MQRIVQAVRSRQQLVKAAILEHSRGRETTKMEKLFARFGWITPSSSVQEKGLENVTVAEVLLAKGGENTGSWLWCHSDDIVNDAVKNMAQNNIGSLVVLKPEQPHHVAGIITERDYLRKIILEGRSPMHTRVGEIMTDESKLVTVTSDTNILQAMQIMTERRIRHVPVIDGKLIGMISIKDVVRAVVEQQSGELKRLNDYIRGEYY
ncbi:CBS domain containing protein [Parasponia andersonii]|uniref:CBS domain containing protein n=1 Tax=Parasponia andersonii TaxID=3476 RepID=A0A2P5AWK7_PARAD|nr:CBS domain containing protein [Parasponia andersonii]